ncbi:MULTISPECIES: hypothetical protein, partial [unclassified Vibrio]|uniref:hypothetical protein n=1 Tax=unclassified Vibrio TaxID=2614977 RepID=UPI002964032F
RKPINRFPIVSHQKDRSTDPYLIYIALFGGLFFWEYGALGNAVFKRRRYSNVLAFCFKNSTRSGIEAFY